VRTYTTPLGLIRNFESQFERDGMGGYLYRLEGKGKPIPVGAGEPSPPGASRLRAFA
jgi:hypothetical protein